MASLALIVLAAAPLSCSDMAVKPRVPIKLTGVVLDRDGIPMGGVYLGFQDLAGPADYYGGYPTTQTGPTGAYAIDLPASRYTLFIQPPDNSGYPRARVPELDLRSGSTRFDYRYTGFKITGTVTEPGGGSLNFGFVSAYSESAGANALIGSGSFSLVLPGGRYRFTVGAPPFYAPGVPVVTYYGVVVASDTALVFSLDGHAVSGTVTGQAGQPLGGAFVQAFGLRANSSATTAVNGTYILYVPAGDYDWRVRPGSFDSNILSRSFPLSTVTAPETKDFDMSGVTWNGVVRRADSGQPVPGAQVTVYGSSGDGYQQAGSGGEFTFIVKPYGIYTVSASSYSQNLRGYLQGVEALNDSTFDILVSPASDGPLFAPPASSRPGSF